MWTPLHLGSDQHRKTKERSLFPFRLWMKEADSVLQGFLCHLKICLYIEVRKHSELGMTDPLFHTVSKICRHFIIIIIIDSLLDANTWLPSKTGTRNYGDYFENQLASYLDFIFFAKQFFHQYWYQLSFYNTICSWTCMRTHFYCFMGISPGLVNIIIKLKKKTELLTHFC